MGGMIRSESDASIATTASSRRSSPDGDDTEAAAASTAVASATDAGADADAGAAGATAVEKDEDEATDLMAAAEQQLQAPQTLAQTDSTAVQSDDAEAGGVLCNSPLTIIEDYAKEPEQAEGRPRQTTFQTTTGKNLRGKGNTECIFTFLDEALVFQQPGRKGKLLFLALPIDL